MLSSCLSEKKKKKKPQDHALRRTRKQRSSEYNLKKKINEMERARVASSSNIDKMRNPGKKSDFATSQETTVKFSESLKSVEVITKPLAEAPTTKSDTLGKTVSRPIKRTRSGGFIDNAVSLLPHIDSLQRKDLVPPITDLNRKKAERSFTVDGPQKVSSVTTKKSISPIPIKRERKLSESNGKKFSKLKSFKSDSAEELYTNTTMTERVVVTVLKSNSEEVSTSGDKTPVSVQMSPTREENTSSEDSPHQTPHQTEDDNIEDKVPKSPQTQVKSTSNAIFPNPSASIPDEKTSDNVEALKFVPDIVISPRPQPPINRSRFEVICPDGTTSAVPFSETLLINLFNKICINRGYNTEEYQFIDKVL